MVKISSDYKHQQELKMKFYTNIADYYDYIFPYNQMHKDFILSCNSNSSSRRLLDIGCGTGNLSLELSKRFKSVTSIDLDSEMINKANSKSEAMKNINFTCMNMLKIKKEFQKKSFDSVVSLGNTIVHLSNLNEINTFFAAVREVLKPSSPFLFQIINYERILEQNIDSLPTIENKHIKFKRNYYYNEPQKLIEFSTILTIKETGALIESKVNLYPLLSSDIRELLTNNGFKNIKFYGSFKKELFNPTASVPLIVEANN
jgi:glycine/sarcosine N-methyltransferase